MRVKLCVMSIVAGLTFCGHAWAEKPIAPRAPWSPIANKRVALWSKLMKKHLTKQEMLSQSCNFPSATVVGVKAYPGSLIVDMHRGGGSAADSEDLPMVELVTKDPLEKVIAWYKKHYPRLKAKYMFETAGPGISFQTSNEKQYKKHPASAAVALEGSLFGGCGGLLQVPVAYQTGISIYYQPQGQ